MKRKQKIQKIYKSIINFIHILHAFHPQPSIEVTAVVPVSINLYYFQNTHPRAVGEQSLPEALKAPGFDFSLQGEIAAIESYPPARKVNQVQSLPSRAD